MIVTRGLGGLLITRGYGWTEVTTATPVEAVQPPPKYVLHGFNRLRLLQWGGRYRPR